MKTPERVAEAQRLRAEGLTLREVGERFGVSLGTVHAWLSDPDGTLMAERRAASAERCAGRCTGCGAKTNGSRGRRNAPTRCQTCAVAEDRVWTPAAVILAIQEWAAEYGDPPACADWSPTRARILNDEARAARFEAADGCWPHENTVRYAFGGSWPAALAAAGFTPRAPHGGAGNQYRRRSQRAAA